MTWLYALNAPLVCAATVIVWERARYGRWPWDARWRRRWHLRFIWPSELPAALNQGWEPINVVPASWDEAGIKREGMQIAVRRHQGSEKG